MKRRLWLALLLGGVLLPMALLEIPFDEPVDPRYTPRFYLLYAGFFGLFLLPAAARKPFKDGLALYLIFFAGLLVLWAVPWTSRERFVRRLFTVRPGMTVEQVEQIIGGYIRGTGWPANPEEHYVDRTVVDPDTGREYRARSGPSEELTVKDAVVYRHNATDGRYNSDWGLVRFQDGKVVEVDFLPD